MTDATRPPHLTQDHLKRLHDGQHDSPFDILGPHNIAGKTWVTAFVPDAIAVEAVVNKKAMPLPRIEGAVFSGALPPRSKSYKLRARYETGADWNFEDPYRFGPVLGDVDQYLITEGTHRRLWHALGAHVREVEGVKGTHFAVWAPNARRVSVVGDFNAWDGRRHQMRRSGNTGVWEIFLPEIGEGALYQYEVITNHGTPVYKADPVGFGAQHPPEKASMVRDISGYGWKDQGWMISRAAVNRHDAPISIYEVHLGSWRRRYDGGGRPLSYKELAVELIDYAVDMGFTHLEFLPISEFPFDGSWGYQPIGLYAPTIRFGPPHEFRDLVEAAHNAGLGVILDWVPGHFPTDAHGLADFDGTHLYEHSDPREGFHHDWNTLIYNYGRTEVRNFLMANALYWLEEYHVDGLRVDAVASMLYRDYSRNEGEWIPNVHGGRENLEAISFLQEVNSLAYGTHTGIMTAAEESTAYPGVSRPVDTGGLGFGFKWNMGWMNDTLRYIAKDPIYRSYEHDLMTFGIHYAFSENFILPISHDEVVHGKGSMLSKMPGNEWEQFANLRAYYGFMWAHPGKKLLFMGCEFAQRAEWNHNIQIDWDALHGHMHRGVQALVRDLNRLYRDTPALYVKDCDGSGFQWLGNDAQQSTLGFIRYGGEGDPPAVVICNFTPVERLGFRVGVPIEGLWREVLNTDAEAYGGGNRGNMGAVGSDDTPWDGQEQSIVVTLPPLSTLVFLQAGAEE